MIPHILTAKITFLLLLSFFICKKAVSGDFKFKKNFGNITNKIANMITIIPVINILTTSYI